MRNQSKCGMNSLSFEKMRGKTNKKYKFSYRVQGICFALLFAKGSSHFAIEMKFSYHVQGISFVLFLAVDDGSFFQKLKLIIVNSIHSRQS